MSIEENIEQLIGELYQQFYKLRQEKKYQEEYNIMGTLIGMLTKDRQHIRSKYKVEL
jgi:hypothetical protein